jgi:hypothetical protein
MVYNRSPSVELVVRSIGHRIYFKGLDASSQYSTFVTYVEHALAGTSGSF